MTLEDFISRFNSTELHDALNIQGLPNVGTHDDKIIKLAASGSTKTEIASLLAGLEEYRLREISLDFEVAGAAKLSRKGLTTRVIQIVVGEYKPFGQGLSEIKNLKTLALLSAAASMTMIIFITTALLYSNAIAFLSAIAFGIPASLFLYGSIKTRLQKNGQKTS
jgi:hypothetical protein